MSKFVYERLVDQISDAWQRYGTTPIRMLVITPAHDIAVPRPSSVSTQPGVQASKRIVLTTVLLIDPESTSFGAGRTQGAVVLEQADNNKEAIATLRTLFASAGAVLPDIVRRGVAAYRDPTASDEPLAWWFALYSADMKWTVGQGIELIEPFQTFLDTISKHRLATDVPQFDQCDIQAKLSETRGNRTRQPTKKQREARKKRYELRALEDKILSEWESHEYSKYVHFANHLNDDRSVGWHVVLDEENADFSAENIEAIIDRSRKRRKRGNLSE